MTCLTDQVDDHLLVDPQVVAISASEAGLGEARTWDRIIGTDRILSGTVLVNALCLLDGLDLVEEEAGITITDVLVRPRDAEGHHRHEVVVVMAVDAAAVNEAVETGSRIVLYPVLLRKPGIDTGFDALALYSILFYFTACRRLWPVCRLPLLAITIFVYSHIHGAAATGSPWKKKKSCTK